MSRVRIALAAMPLAAIILAASPEVRAQAPPAQAAAPSPGLAGTPALARASGQAQAPSGGSKVFNPDISVIGNFLGVAGKNERSEAASLSLTEAEVSFQAAVDPYSRADFFLGVSEEGLEIEEGYITFTALPARLLLKAGKLKAQFGKVNTLHTHQVPYADRPLVTENLVGGEEGLSDAGVSLSHLIENPVLFLEVTGEVFRGQSDVFQSPKRSELNYVGRVRAYRDLTEATNLDLGSSFAWGPTDVGIDEGVPGLDEDPLRKRLVGVDATFRYRPLRQAIYRRLNLRTELVWSRQELPDGAHTTAFGAYGVGEYQFARRWYAGARLDRSGRAIDASLVDTGGAAFLTFWPTEFSQIRGQYRRIHYAEGLKGNEWFLQLNFSIGAHGAHIF